MILNSKKLKQSYRKNIALAEHLEKKIDVMPKCRVHISISNGKFQYYLYEGDNVRIYANRKIMHKVRDGIQREYYEKLLHLIKQKMLLEKKILDNIEEYEKMDEENALWKICEGKRILLKEHLPTREETIKKWLEQPYSSHNSFVKKENLRSKKGEYMRSLSELQIANMLYEAKIPYKYECPLKIDDRVKYPDFTIMHPRTLEIIYWEHVGRLEDKNYLVNFIQKIDFYESAGIYQGERLIVTMSCLEEPLRVDQVKGYIDRYLS